MTDVINHISRAVAEHARAIAGLAVTFPLDEEGQVTLAQVVVELDRVGIRLEKLRTRMTRVARRGKQAGDGSGDQ